MALCLAILCFCAIPLWSQDAGESLLDDLVGTTSAAVAATESALQAAGGDSGKEELDFWDDMDGPSFRVVSDARSKTEYVISETETAITEYHDLKKIEYSSLVYVLTSLLRKITEDGFVYASDFKTDYGRFPYPTLVYRRPKDAAAAAEGVIQFPSFKITVSGKKKRDAAHPYDIRDAKILQSRMFAFIMLLAEIQDTIGASNDDLLQFFAPSGSGEPAK